MLFILGGFSLIQDGKYIQASVQVIAGIMNLIMLLYSSSNKWQLKGHLAIFLMNIVVCLMVAYYTQNSGKTYIQFVWLFSALLSAIAMVIFYRRRHKSQ